MTDPDEGLRCARDLGGGIAGKPQPELRGTQETVASTLQEAQRAGAPYTLEPQVRSPRT